MKIYSGGEIVLLNLPFSSGNATKRRPALVVIDTGDNDIIVMRITSQMYQTGFDLQVGDWKQAGLLVPSTIRIHKPATVEKNIVNRVLGRLTASDWAAVKSRLNAWIV